MKPRNKTEREVVKLSDRIPGYQTSNVSGPSRLASLKMMLTSMVTDFQEGVSI